MARVTINDLKPMNLTEDDVKHVTGGGMSIIGASASKVLLGDGSVRFLSNTVSNPLLNFEIQNRAVKIG